MLLSEVVSTSSAVAATRSRKAKVAAIAELLARAEPGEREVVTAYVGGTLRQRRTGVGWRGIATMPAAAASSSLTVLEVDAAFAAIAALAGAGSQGARAGALADLLGRATADEQTWLRGVVTGAVRQGALDSLVQEGVAVAAGLPLAAVRRAAMLAGSTQAVVEAAFDGGEAALASVGLEVMRPVLPMLASSAKSVDEALVKAHADRASVAVDTKLDGIRIQVHRQGDDVLVVTRSLDDITARLPEVVAVARAIDATSFVLDGEVLALDDTGRPRPFQETASRTAQDDGVRVTPFFFDVLHLDGRDLLDEPGAERAAVLEALVPPAHRVPRVVTADPVEAQGFVDDVLAAGHEGVVVKDLAAPYAAGRRGAAWVKVKPVHTLDLVVLAVEWGSGRRQGWLSNIHLGARDPAQAGRPGGSVTLGTTLDGTSLPVPEGWVPVGKTFKGMTDDMLAWQTERFTQLAMEPSAIRDRYVVAVHPVQVVEIALDGVQRSSRYPGGVALRFARVVRYRDDKAADDADTIGTVQSHLGAPGPG